MVKHEKFDQFHLVYHFTVPLKNYADVFLEICRNYELLLLLSRDFSVNKSFSKLYNYAFRKHVSTFHACNTSNFVKKKIMEIIDWIDI